MAGSLSLDAVAGIAQVNGSRVSILYEATGYPFMDGEEPLIMAEVQISQRTGGMLVVTELIINHPSKINTSFSSRSLLY